MIREDNKRVNLILKPPRQQQPISSLRGGNLTCNRRRQSNLYELSRQSVATEMIPLRIKFEKVATIFKEITRFAHENAKA